MNTEHVETFLEVVATGNITEAARRLCVSQGAVSTRLQQLEQELGVTLLMRQRGVKTVSLTPEGECFRTLAKQWRSLEQQAHEIKNLLSYRELRIAAIDTINTFVFPDLYVEHIEKHPRTRLFIQTEHSTEIHQLIAQQEIDVGFAYTLHPAPDVISCPLYREHMTVLCHRDAAFVRTGNLADLDCAREVRAIVSTSFAAWHRRAFPHATSRLTTVGTHSMLPSFLALPGAWSIVSESVASRLAETSPELTSVPFEHDGPPTRTVHCLTYRRPRPWVQELTDIFLDDVRNLVASTPYLELIE